MFKRCILPFLLLTITAVTLFSLPLTGTKIIYAYGGYDYTTITDAINDLNTNGVGAGGVVFLIIGTYYENPPAITATGTESNPIIFSQAESGGGPLEAVLVPTGGTNSYGFKLSASDYVTFQYLTINAPSDLTYGFWLEGLTQNGFCHKTIRNCTINLPNPEVGSYAIYMKNNPTSTNSCDYNLIADNTISSCYGGVYMWLSGWDTNTNVNNTIRNNILTGIRGTAFYHNNGVNTLITNNYVSFATNLPNDLTLIKNDGNYCDVTVSYNTFTGGSTTRNVNGFMHMNGQSHYEYNTISNINCEAYTWTGFYAYYGNAEFNHNTISNITCNAICFFTGAYFMQGSHTMRNNEISGVTSYGDLIGIKIEEGTTHYIINNKIHGLHYIGGANHPLVYGIQIMGTTENYFINNMIYDLTSSQINSVHVTGIYAMNEGTDHFWHNTVYLNASGTSPYFTTVALRMVLSGIIDLQNNILINTSTPGSSGYTYVLMSPYSSFSSFSAATDNNIYYAGTPGPRRLIGYFDTTAHQTLAAYQAAAATIDQNSYTENVPFVSPTGVIDLHINPVVPTLVEGNAHFIDEVIFDIDGDGRNEVTPDIGADEGDFTPVITELEPPEPAFELISDHMSLNWTAVPGATHYIIYRSDNPYTGFTIAGSTTGTNWTDTSPTQSKRFYYITAEN
jgi:hypothetical protein